MMRTRPARRTTLQFSHRTLTDGLTFIPASFRAPLLESVRDPAAGQVVGGELHLDLVPGQDPDEVHAHLAGHVRQHLVAVVELHAEHGVGEGLYHGALDLNGVFFGHGQAAIRVRTSGPSSVMAMVSSKWAAMLPSTVTAVQPSSSTCTSQEPRVTMGSIASTMLALSAGPRPASPKFGTCGSSWSARPIPWPTNERTTPKPWLSQCICTACEMSPIRLPTRHCTIALSRLSRVTSMSSCTRGATAPTGSVIAQSA